MEHIIPNQITLSINQSIMNLAISKTQSIKNGQDYAIFLDELFGISTRFVLHLPCKNPNLLTVETIASITPENLIEAKLMFDFAIDLRNYLNGSYEDFEYNFPEFVKIFVQTNNRYIKK